MYFYLLTPRRVGTFCLKNYLHYERLCLQHFRCPLHIPWLCYPLCANISRTSTQSPSTISWWRPNVFLSLLKLMADSRTRMLTTPVAPHPFPTYTSVTEKDKPTRLQVSQTNAALPDTNIRCNANNSTHLTSPLPPTRRKPVSHALLPFSAFRLPLCSRISTASILSPQNQINNKSLRY